MRAYVFTDRSLARHAGRFVWLSLDAEKAKNAAVRKKLGIPALPTMFVVDPRDEHVAIRWVGAANARQLDRLFDDGVLAMQGGASGDSSLQALVQADRLYGEEKYAEAAPHYRRALEAAPATWPAAPRATDALLFAYTMSEQYEPAAELAERAWPSARPTAGAASVAAMGLDAALQLPKEHARRATWLLSFEEACREVLADTSLGVAADDLSGVWFSLGSAREDAGDSTGTAAVRAQHIAFLEREAARAKTPEQRAVFDSHRLSLYMEVGTPEKAVPMLEQSERDFPADYNPSQRLATAYKAMKKWPEALAASDRAMAKAYGPRQFLLYNTRADIQVGLGDEAAAIATLKEAIAKAEAMPEGQRSQRTVDGFKKRLADLEK